MFVGHRSCWQKMINAALGQGQRGAAMATIKKMNVKPIRPKLLKKKEVVRTLDTEENIAIANELNELIEELHVARAYHFVYSKLRAEVNNYRSLSKRHFREKRIHKIGDVYEQDTNVGTIQVYGTRSISRKTEFITKALDNLGLKVDTKLLIGDSRYVVDVDSDGMKLEPEFIENTSKLLEEYQEFQKEIEVLETSDDKELDQATRYVAARSAFVREIMHEARKYTPLYGKIKNLFVKSSGVGGTFPRVYQYRGLSLGWTEVCDITSAVKQIISYVENLEMQTGIPYRQKLDLEVLKLNESNENIRIQIKLDGVDYLSGEDV